MLLSDLRGERVAVWGAGREGWAAVSLLSRYDLADLVLVDDAPTATGPEGTPLLTGSAGADALAGADVVVKSPGISRHRPEVARLEAHGVEVTGGMALWLEAMADEVVVGVTGTKGKSTTASLLHRLLEAFDRPAVLAGNIGVPVLSLLGDVAPPRPPGCVYVVEISSYQAADVRASPALGVLTCLYPEHLDWHGSLDRYLEDKLNLFAHGGPGTAQLLVGPHVALGDDRLARLEHLGAVIGAPGAQLVTADGLALGGGEVLRPGEWALPGRHNLENAALAVAAAEALGVPARADPARLRATLETFAPLAHRLSVLGRTAGGLEFVDDTLSTVPQSTMAALAAFGDRPVTVIVGGHDRGVDVAALAGALADRRAPTAVACVPDTGLLVARAIEARGAAAGGPVTTVVVVEGLEAAVAWAVARTPAGGVVLLSPAAPSYNRYRSHEELSGAFAELFERHRAA